MYKKTPLQSILCKKSLRNKEIWAGGFIFKYQLLDRNIAYIMYIDKYFKCFAIRHAAVQKNEECILPKKLTCFHEMSAGEFMTSLLINILLHA